jgi:hypothetical protein
VVSVRAPGATRVPLSGRRVRVASIFAGALRSQRSAIRPTTARLPLGLLRSVQRRARGEGNLGAFGAFQFFNALPLSRSCRRAQREQIIALAARYAIAISHPRLESVKLGALTSYGADLSDAFRPAGQYVGRILNGEKPGDLPVQPGAQSAGRPPRALGPARFYNIS